MIITRLIKEIDTLHICKVCLSTFLLHLWSSTASGLWGSCPAQIYSGLDGATSKKIDLRLTSVNYILPTIATKHC